MIKFMLTTLKSIVILYILLVIIIFFLQRSLLYMPAKDMKNPNIYGLPMMSGPIETDDGEKLVGWYRKAEDGKPSIIFFHGNAGHLGYRAKKYLALMREGYGLLAVSYRGYGQSTGSPTEEGLYNDARASIKFIQDKFKIKESDIILYGESLGTGVAVQMATEFNIKAVILEAPFTSMVDMAKKLYPIFPVGIMLKDRFESLNKISSVKIPVLLMHGKQDKLIPYSHSQSLYDSANEPKKIILFPDSGHNDNKMEDIVESVNEFVSAI